MENKNIPNFDIAFIINQLKHEGHGKISRKEMAKIAGVNESTLYSWQNKKDCPLSFICEISRKFNISIEKLIPSIS